MIINNSFITGFGMNRRHFLKQLLVGALAVLLSGQALAASYSVVIPASGVAAPGGIIGQIVGTSSGSQDTPGQTSLVQWLAPSVQGAFYPANVSSYSIAQYGGWVTNAIGPTITYPKPVKFSRIIASSYGSNGYTYSQTLTIQAMVSGQWTTIGNAIMPIGGYVDVSFAPVVTSEIKVTTVPSQDSPQGPYQSVYYNGPQNTYLVFELLSQ